MAELEFIHSAGDKEDKSTDQDDKSTDQDDTEVGKSREVSYEGLQKQDRVESSRSRLADRSKVRIADRNEFSSQPLIPILKSRSSKDVDMSKLLTPNDTRDPSYTNLTLPYSVICRQRYRDAGAKQKAQFIKEMKCHELLQSKSLDGVRIHREFCNALLSPIKPEQLITLTRQQKERIEQILARHD